jgi:hypothetical protein
MGKTVSRIRLQAWATNRRGTEYTVNLDGVPLGCDGLFSDPALVIIVGQEAAKVPHGISTLGAMVFLEKDRHRARSAAAKALKEYEALQVERGKGVHFDREEAQKLRALAEYLMRGYVGPHAATVMMIRRKVPR